MNKNYLKIIPLVIVLTISVLLIMHELSTSFPDMTGEEFHEKFDNESIVKHFKLTYPENFSGVGKNAAMITLAWGYGSGNSDGILAELRVQENFGKYEFTYYCGDVGDTYVSVNIKNPTIEDIDNNLCW